MMIRSALFGAVAGMRSLTPLAVIAVAARRGELPRDIGAPAVIANPVVVAGALALAVGEVAGDKWRKAPDRIVPAGIGPRLVVGALAGAAVAPRDRRATAAAIGAAAAVAFAYVSFALRMKALRRWGQVPTGAIEDVFALASAAALVRGAT